MEYKAFTYTPIPKTAWDNLSMLEKSEMMKVAVRNGITDLKTIREKYNEFAEGGGMEGSMNTIPEDYAPLASPTWQPVIDKMKQDSYKSNVEDFAYRVQKMHPEITQQQVEEAYKSVPIIASDSRRGRELGKYVFGDESGYGQRIMLYPNRMKEDQGVGGLTKEDQLRSAMGHETNHLYVHTLLGNNHTDEEKALLDAAYPDDLFHVPEGGNIYDEKRAYNMQVRNALSKAYGNVVGADYDKATEKMKPNDVMWNYSQLGSGYMSDYQKVKQKYKKGSKWDQNQVDAILKATKDVAYTPTVNPYEYEEGVNYAALGGPLIEDTTNEYRDGGSIHIKPSKRGTFTAAAKKHGKSVQAFASQVLAHPENYSPAMRKKANFARNASHWKHGLGGNLYSNGGIFGDLVNSLGQKIVSVGKAIGLIDSTPKSTVYVSKPTGRRFKTKKEAKMDAYAYNQAAALTRKTNSIPARHIGSDNKNPFEQRKETWNQFWQQEPVMQHAVDSIASRYGVNPDALRYRLNTEGFTEGMIHQRNDSVKSNKPIDRGYRLLNQKVGENEYAWYNSEGKEWSTTPGDNAGFMIFGLDDTADYINKGQAFPINERWSDQYNTNEKGRTVHSATGETIAENIGLLGATLKMFTDQAREDFPNASDADIARYGLAYYNRGRKGGKKWVKNGAKGYYYK